MPASRCRTKNSTLSPSLLCFFFVFFFQAEDGIRDLTVTGVQTCALPISHPEGLDPRELRERIARLSIVDEHSLRRRLDKLGLDKRGLDKRGTALSPERLRSEEHTSELQSQSNLVCRLLLEKKKKKNYIRSTHLILHAHMLNKYIIHTHPTTV